MSWKIALKLIYSVVVILGNKLKYYEIANQSDYKMILQGTC